MKRKLWKTNSFMLLNLTILDSSFTHILVYAIFWHCALLLYVQSLTFSCTDCLTDYCDNLIEFDMLHYCAHCHCSYTARFKVFCGSIKICQFDFILLFWRSPGTVVVVFQSIDNLDKYFQSEDNITPTNML